MEDVERARLQLRAEQRCDHARYIVRLDDEGSRRLRKRMEPEARARDQREPSLGAAHEAGEVVARDVLDDLSAGVGDGPVAEHEGRAEDEIARRAESMTQRAGFVPCEERADRRVA